MHSLGMEHLGHSLQDLDWSFTFYSARATARTLSVADRRFDVDHLALKGNQCA
jgi:hypothetical protein